MFIVCMQLALVTKLVGWLKGGSLAFESDLGESRTLKLPITLARTEDSSLITNFFLLLSVSNEQRTCTKTSSDVHYHHQDYNYH